MPLRVRQYAVLAAMSLTAVVAACSSSTSPKAETPQQLASHFDSIYSALNASDSVDYKLFAEFVAIGEVAPAYGVQPTSVTVTTQSGTQSWKGFAFELADTGTNGDSTFFTFLYSDQSLSHFILATSSYNSSGYTGSEAALVVNFRDGGFSLTDTGSVSLLSAGSGSCTLESGLAAQSFFGDTVLAGLNCQQPASMQVSFHATFAAGDSAGVLSQVSISNATFNGLRFVASVAPGSHVARIPSRMAALGQRLMDWRALNRH